MELGTWEGKTSVNASFGLAETEQLISYVYFFVFTKVQASAVAVFQGLDY